MASAPDTGGNEGPKFDEGWRTDTKTKKHEKKDSESQKKRNGK